MATNNFLNFMPRKTTDLVITKKKFVIALVVFLAMFAMAKTYIAGSLRKEIFSSKMYVALASIKNINDTAKFNEAFTDGDFCGWQISDETGRNVSSPNYAQTSEGNEKFEQDLIINEVKNHLSICIVDMDRYDSSVRKQAMGILLITAIIIFFLLNTRFEDDETKDLTEEDILAP